MDLSLKIKNEVLYCISRVYYRLNRPKIKILSIDETIDYLSVEGNSLVRYGDGEFSIMSHHKIDNYQDVNDQLAIKLQESIMVRNDKILVCLPEILCNMSLCSKNRKSRMNWLNNYFRNRDSYKRFIDEKYVYGNAFVSRAYLIYPDKSKCDLWFARLRNIFRNKDILLIEGKYSRSGVGNNLFSEAKSVCRILCPPTNAFDKYDEIVDAACNNMQGKLVLVAIGPTSKPLAVELASKGTWVIDIGHLDSEYEWYLNRSQTKTILQNKHTAEQPDFDIGECDDTDYLASIISVIE